MTEPQKDQIIKQDFTGSISGFDFPHAGFSPDILASQAEFGSGMPRHTRYIRTELAEKYGREDEAYESED